MTLLVKVAEENPPPMIDLDFTVVIQFGFFLILLLVLSRFLFKPYLKMKDERKLGIDGARDKARDMEERARKMVADYDAAFSRAKLRGAEERQKVRAEAAGHERQVLGAARDEAQRALGVARGKIATDAEKARAKLEAEATGMARLVASRILGREVG